MTDETVDHELNKHDLLRTVHHDDLYDITLDGTWKVVGETRAPGPNNSQTTQYYILAQSDGDARKDICEALGAAEVARSEAMDARYDAERVAQVLKSELETSKRARVNAEKRTEEYSEVLKEERTENEILKAKCNRLEKIVKFAKEALSEEDEE